MIKSIATIAVYVTDQKRAEMFWVEKVGFKVITRNDMGNGNFWLEIGPKASQTRLVIYPKSLMRNWQEMKPSLVFECDDLKSTQKKLKERGVEIGDLQKSQWGTFCFFKDEDQNEFILKS